jgi:hypothetical protein
MNVITFLIVFIDYSALGGCRGTPVFVAGSSCDRNDSALPGVAPL